MPRKRSVLHSCCGALLLAVQMSGAQEIQHFETLLRSGQDKHASESSHAGGGLRGPVYNEIASAIHAHDGCADQVGLTAIRINGHFATCDQLVHYCDKYDQVAEACPVSCGRCDHLIANAAASVLDTAHQGEVPETGQNADGDDGTATTTTTATHHLVELAVNVPKVIADDSDENSEGAEDNDDNGDSDGVVAEDDAEAPDKMTPQEHVLALTLLLKQVSMENEHLKLSMSQCEADVLDLKMRLIDQHSEKS